jgi:hypothetical protein
MIDPKDIDLKQLPKKFCDGAIGGHSKEFFSFVLTSGNSLDSYAATPQVMKSIAQWVNSQVDMYEKTYGSIDMSVHSPIQSGDLNQPSL